MKRYLIFAAINPFLGGLLLLFATTFASGYWTHTNWAEVGKFVAAFVKTLQFAYLFGIVPALMMGAIDDILLHVRRIGPVVRMLIVGTIGFAAAELHLRLARAGLRRGAILPLWHRRLRAGDAVVVAGAQICRGAAGGDDDVGIYAVIARIDSDEAIHAFASGEMDCFRLRSLSYGGQVASLAITASSRRTPGPYRVMPR